MSPPPGQERGSPGRRLRRLISLRRLVQAAVGAGIAIALAQGWVELPLILAIGLGLGLLFGKMFCRWMCPMGFFMEFMLGADPDEGRGSSSLYLYHKMGCPIAWVGGLLNRFSWLRVRLNAKKCTQCGRCDQACYVTQHDPETSLYQQDRSNASQRYACSRCLACVKACPHQALGLLSPHE